MEGEGAVVFCQHGMNGMTQLVGEGRHFATGALIVDQHERRHIR